MNGLFHGTVLLFYYKKTLYDILDFTNFFTFIDFNNNIRIYLLTTTKQHITLICLSNEMMLI